MNMALNESAYTLTIEKSVILRRLERGESSTMWANEY